MRTLVNLGPLGPMLAVAAGRLEPELRDLRHLGRDASRHELPIASRPDAWPQPATRATDDFEPLTLKKAA